MKADKQATAAALQTLVNAQSAGGGNIRSAATPTGRLEVVFWALLMALSERHKVLISIDCVQILITCSIFTLFTRNQYNFAVCCAKIRILTYLIEKVSMVTRVFVAIATLLCGLASSVVLAGDADFTLVNQTGYDLREVYISPANRNAWGRDRLGKDTLDNNKSRLFTFSDNANCVQDLRVVFDDDDSSVVWKGLDLCEINKLTIKYNRRTDTVSVTKE